jgi:hypothetical protein
MCGKKGKKACTDPPVMSYSEYNLSFSFACYM